jgi:hypothetical protein
MLPLPERSSVIKVGRQYSCQRSIKGKKSEKQLPEIQLTEKDLAEFQLTEIKLLEIVRYTD